MEPSSSPVSMADTRRLERRSYMKCQACREAKKKCVPVDRDWSKRELCDRCAHRKLECGPHRRVSDLPGVALPAPALLGKPPTSQPPSPRLPPAVSPSSQSSDPVADLSRIPEPDVPPRESEAGGRADGISAAVTDATDADTLETELARHAPRTRKESAIQDRFTRLNRANDQHNYLHKRRFRTLDLRAIIGIALEQDDERSFQLVLTFLNFAIHWWKERFTDCYERILELLEDVSPSEREASLLRLRSASETFADSARRMPNSFQRCEEKSVGRLGRLQHSTLQRLLCTYECLGDMSEIHRVRHHLKTFSGSAVAPPSDTDLQTEALAVCDMSGELNRFLSELDHENSYTQYLVTNGKSFPSLHIALIFGKTQVAQHLCSKFPFCLEEIDVLGRNALHVAAELSNLDFLRYIIAQDSIRLKTQLKERDMWSLSPLFVAAYIGDLECFKTLLAAGADLDEMDGQGRDILYYASASGHVSIVSFLLDQRNTNSNRTLPAGAALHGASAAGHEAVCRKLVEHGASVTWTPTLGRTARVEALANGHLAVVEILRHAERHQETRSTQLKGTMGVASTPSGPFSRNCRTSSPTVLSSRSETPHLTVDSDAYRSPIAHVDWIHGLDMARLVSPHLSLSSPNSSNYTGAIQRPDPSVPTQFSHQNSPRDCGTPQTSNIIRTIPPACPIYTPCSSLPNNGPACNNFYDALPALGDAPFGNFADLSDMTDQDYDFQIPPFS